MVRFWRMASLQMVLRLFIGAVFATPTWAARSPKLSTEPYHTMSSMEMSLPTSVSVSLSMSMTPTSPSLI